MEFKYAVLIGRFQPFHRGHLAVVEHGLEIAENVIIIVGSANAAPSVRNPFSFEERKAMIESALSDDARRRVQIHGVRDYYYNENAWLSDVQAKTDLHIEDGDSVALLGAFKDTSSYYLRSFPQWEYVPAPITDATDATALRESLIGHPSLLDWEGKRSTPPPLDEIRESVSEHTYEMLAKWVTTPLAGALAKEWEHYKEYRERWSEAPFPPVFVTADAVVTCSGHVLIVRRKINPGKGLLALPGGFVQQRETVREAAIRELREETRIKVDKLILDSNIVEDHVFDHPDRSLRGRTISHGFHIALKDGKLPEVRGGDDAAEAFWMPLWDVIRSEEKFFEDHCHIVTYFTRVGAQ